VTQRDQKTNFMYPSAKTNRRAEHVLVGASETTSYSAEGQTASKGLATDEPSEFDFRRDILPSTKQPHDADSAWTFAPTPNDSSMTEKFDVQPLVRVRSRNSVRRVEVLQQFEGVVTEVGEDYFVARMHDLTNSESEIEVMEFDLREISEQDHEILQPGSVFYWTIGYETRVGGQVVRISEMRVQRNPIWTKAKLDSVESEALRIFEKLNENPSAQTR